MRSFRTRIGLPYAPLAIERAARIDECDRECEHPDDWRGKKQERHRDDQIDGALQLLAVVAGLSAQLHGDEAVTIANLETKRRRLTQLGNYKDLPSTQPIQRSSVPGEALAIRHDYHFRTAVGAPSIKRAEHGKAALVSSESCRGTN